MEQEKNIKVGFTRKPHGIKGEIKLQIEDRYLEDVLNTEILLVELKGKHLPFFIMDIRGENTIIAKLEDIDTPEKAGELTNKSIFLRPQDIIPEDEREIEVYISPFEQTEGFSVYDIDTLIGVVGEIVEYPQQLMASITYESRTILIPLNETFLVKIDRKEKKIVMDLPEGLLDL